MIDLLKNYKTTPKTDDHYKLRLWFELLIGPRCLSAYYKIYPSLYMGQEMQSLKNFEKIIKDIEESYPEFINITFEDKNKNYDRMLKTRTLSSFRAFRIDLSKVHA